MSSNNNAFYGTRLYNKTFLISMTRSLQGNIFQYSAYNID